MIHNCCFLSFKCLIIFSGFLFLCKFAPGHVLLCILVANIPLISFFFFAFELGHVAEQFWVFLTGVNWSISIFVEFIWIDIAVFNQKPNKFKIPCSTGVVQSSVAQRVFDVEIDFVLLWAGVTLRIFQYLLHQ